MLSIKYMNLFQTVTGATVIDCIENEAKKNLTFVIKEGQAGLAIGKNGINIKNLEGAMSKRIEIIEYSDDPVKFITGLFRPARINKCYVSQKSDGIKSMNIQLDPEKIGLAKSKMATAKSLLEKYFDIQELKLVR